MQDGTGGVAHMDLIDPPPVRGGWSLRPDVDHGPSFEEIFQEHRAARAVNASQPAHQTTRREGFLLRFAENAAGFPVGMGGPRFIDPFSTDLRVNTGAGSKEKPVGLREG
jgi:hypothetical protein